MIHSTSPRVTYLNVANGSLKCGPDTYSAYSGVVRGIRTMNHSYQGHTSTKLELLMENPACSDERFARVIISGTLFKENGDVTVWGRMLLARLVGNNLSPDQVITISQYPAGDRGTCCKVSEGYDPFAPSLKGVDFHPDNPTRCARIAQAAVDRLIERYGSFGSRSDRDDEEPAPSRTTPTRQPNIPERINDATANANQPRSYRTPKTQPPTQSHERIIGEDDDLPF